MSGSTYTCAACDSPMTFENFKKFGGAVCVPLRTRNDELVFCLCESCYKKSNRPSADELWARLKQLQNTDLQHSCAFTTLNIVAINGGSLERALECGHEHLTMLRVMARADSFTLLPS